MRTTQQLGCYISQQRPAYLTEDGRLGTGIAQLVELTADANIPEPKMEKRVPG